MNKEKPTVGQIVYSLNVGNAARHSEQKLTKKIVSSVGRKYFKVKNECDDKGWSEIEYYIDGWTEKTDYSANSMLYKSEQEWLDEKECKELCSIISKYFMNGRNIESVSLDKLRKIISILDNK